MLDLLRRWSARLRLRSERGARAPGQVGQTVAAPPVFNLDDLVAGLQQAVGLVQQRGYINAVQYRQREWERRRAPGDGGGFVVHLEADGPHSEQWFELQPATSRSIPVLAEAEFTLDAAVEASGDPASPYALVFGPTAVALGTRLVRVSIRVWGVQPGSAEIRVDGALLKQLGVSATDEAPRRDPP